MADKKVVSKVSKVAKKEVVVEKPVEQVPEVVTESEDESPEVISVAEPSALIEERIKVHIETVDTITRTLKVLKQELKALQVSYLKELKGYKKKKNRVKQSYTPHGFTKAVQVSEVLASFLKQDKDALIARPSVTRAIAKYVRENNLANPDDGSIFKADKLLKTILGEPLYQVKSSKPELGKGYSYQNLQKYLSIHFQKAN